MEADASYEALVRQQLDALGYDSKAIPDDVRLNPPAQDMALSHLMPCVLQNAGASGFSARLR